MTDDEALAAWDAGQTVKTVSMGGLGEAYERALQTAGFEWWRALRANPPKDWDSRKDLDAAKDACVPAVEKALTDCGLTGQYGLSGAQYGAAMNIGAVFARNGYAGGLKMAPADRIIDCRKWGCA